MSTTNEGHVEAMIAKAAKAHTADDAMKFAQAAVNAAKAMCELAAAKMTPK